MRSLPLFSLVFLFVSASKLQFASAPDVSDLPSNALRISTEWRVLAPFPTGDYGSDVTEAFGGIQNLYRHSLPLVSELTDGGWVHWHAVNATLADQDGSQSAQVQITPANMSTSIIESFFGAGGVAWRGWAVGWLESDADVAVDITAQGVRQFYIQRQQQHTLRRIACVGDPYGDGLIHNSVRLDAGRHLIYVPIGGLSTSTQFTLKISVMASDDLVWIDEDVMAPDAVDGRLVSPFLSFSLWNPSRFSTVFVSDAYYRVVFSDGSVIVKDQLPLLVPDQTRPIAVTLPADWIQKHNLSTSVDQFRIEFWRKGQENRLQSKSITIRRRDWPRPFRFTFLDADKTVQKAAAWPPRDICQHNSKGCPVIITTHGAGVDADSDAWTFAYHQQQHAWILFPTNRRRYGYDWEGIGNPIDVYNRLTTGYVNGLKALKSLSKYIAPTFPSYNADADRRIYAGHSMGGHGCMIYSTLQPEYALASVCASGWIRRDLYLSSSAYTTGASRIDHLRFGLLQLSLDEYSTDLHLGNALGKPFMLRMGTDDDNVPVARMLNELNKDSNFTVVSEISGQGHWFDGIVDDDEIQRFLDTHVTREPSLPLNFSLTLFNPATFGGSGGIQVLQLILPYRRASISVVRKDTDDAEWNLKTQNIRRFRIARVQTVRQPATVILDGKHFKINQDDARDWHFYLDGSSWSICHSASWIQHERHPKTYGPARQIFQQAPLDIVYGDSQRYLEQATAIAKTMYYQGRFSPTLTHHKAFNWTEFESIRKNIIVVGTPSDNHVLAALQQPHCPIHFTESCFTVYGTRNETYCGANHAAIYLAPTASALNTMSLIIAGNSVEAITTTMKHLFPVHGSAAIGDWVVVDADRLKSEGAGAFLGFGFWDNHWRWDERIGWLDAPL